MDGTDKWWVYKMFCLLMYADHECITPGLPTTQYDIVINNTSCREWLGMPSVRFFKYLERAHEIGLFELCDRSVGTTSIKFAEPLNKKK